MHVPVGFLLYVQMFFQRLSFSQTRKPQEFPSVSVDSDSNLKECGCGCLGQT